MPIHAISFDLWDTVFIDDSDEPKRKAAGLPSKEHSRRHLVQAASGKELKQVCAAYNAVDAAFCQVWHEQHVTWTVTQRLKLILNGLKVELDAREFTELVRAHEEMELEYLPDLAPGIEQALQQLASHYSLAVISDAIFSPGWALKKILEHYDLLNYFSCCIFSDEAGASKPAAQVFELAARCLGCVPSKIVHIGDRESNDVTGPQEAGMQAILSSVVIDRGSSNSSAQAVCYDYTKLLDLISQLG